MKMARAVLAVSWFLLTGVAWAAPDPLAPLNSFFGKLRTMESDFDQQVLDQRQRVTQSMRGTFVLARPGRFRWDYSKPFEQHIVADGKKLWIYDVDLAQVTVKRQAEGLGSTPAQLLSSQAPLSGQFQIQYVGEQENLRLYDLKPKAKDSGFERVRLGLDKRGLRMMELKDSFGQTTLLRFQNPEFNGGIDDALFEFEPPDGVDVIDETQP